MVCINQDVIYRISGTQGVISWDVRNVFSAPHRRFFRIPEPNEFKSLTIGRIRKRCIFAPARNFYRRDETQNTHFDKPSAEHVRMDTAFGIRADAAAVLPPPPRGAGRGGVRGMRAALAACGSLLAGRQRRGRLPALPVSFPSLCAGTSSCAGRIPFIFRTSPPPHAGDSLAVVDGVYLLARTSYGRL